MTWRLEPLRRIAPPQASKLRFGSDEEVWHLGLEHIESQSGRIIEQRMGPAADAGTSTFVFDEGNVLYSKLRPYLNKVVHPGQAGIATTELVPLRPNLDLIDADYLKYFLRSSAFVSFASACVAGVKMPRVIMDKFWAYPVPLPPLTEQSRIVEILDQADEFRRLRSEADAKSERILPALFMKMFGDPATNPMGWPTGRLDDIVVDTQYGTSQRADTSGAGIAVIRMNNITTSGELDLTDLKYVELSDREVERYLLRQDDILFNRTNSAELVGKTGIWRDQGFEAVSASYLIRVRVDETKAIPRFVWAFMNSPFIKRTLLGKARRAIGMSNINAKELRALPLVLPDTTSQGVFVHLLSAIELGTANRRDAAGKIERIFGNLLHRAFSGDLTASWREAHMKELLQEMEQQARLLGGSGAEVNA